MPNAAHTLQLTLRGAMNSVQTFSTSYWFRYSGGGTITPSSADVASAMVNSSDLEGFIETYEHALSTFMAAYTVWTTWDVTIYGEDPTTPLKVSAAHPVPIGGIASGNLPPECALVASLRTTQAGGSGRGRSYLPLTGLPITGFGQASDANAATVATDVAAFLDAINGHTFAPSVGGPTADLTAVVFSGKLGTTADITSVIVDTRVDAQRRREDKLPGVMHAAAV